MKTIKKRNGVKLVLNLLTNLFEVIKNGVVMFKHDCKGVAVSRFYDIAIH